MSYPSIDGNVRNIGSYSDTKSNYTRWKEMNRLRSNRQTKKSNNKREEEKNNNRE